MKSSSWHFGERGVIAFLCLPPIEALYAQLNIVCNNVEMLLVSRDCILFADVNFFFALCEKKKLIKKTNKKRNIVENIFVLQFVTWNNEPHTVYTISKILYYYQQKMIHNFRDIKGT